LIESQVSRIQERNAERRRWIASVPELNPKQVAAVVRQAADDVDSLVELVRDRDESWREERAGHAATNTEPQRTKGELREWKHQLSDCRAAAGRLTNRINELERKLRKAGVLQNKHLNPDEPSASDQKRFADATTS